jgi:hypothetical protein
LSPTAGNWNIVTANTTVKFAGSGSTLTEDFNLTNLLIGVAGTTLTSGNSNVTLGQFSGSALTSSSGSTFVGSGAGFHATTGTNTFIGLDAGEAVTTGSENVVLGDSSYTNGLTGVYNTVLGSGSGTMYTGAESSNILIRNIGVAAESNVIRIGTQGSGTSQQNKCFIAGIVGVTASNPEMVTINSSTGQLGVAAIPAPLLQQTAIISLTNVQLKALNTTAVTLVAAQGAGIVIIPTSIVFKMIYGGTNVFTFSGTIDYCYGTLPTNAFMTLGSTVITASATTYAASANYVGVIAASICENAAVSIAASTAIAGNAAANNTAEVLVTYYTIAI